jgi:serine/threonine-protein kinase
MMVRNFLWALPFLCFCTGYFGSSYFIRFSSVVVPVLINSSLEKGLAQVSEIRCGLSIIKEVEEEKQKPGTIIQQNPVAGSKIKPHQLIYVIITKSPQLEKVPHLQSMKISQLQEFCGQHHLRLKPYYLESRYPRESCIAHDPRENEYFTQQNVVAYFSAGQTSIRILPSLVGKNYKEVKIFLERYGIAVQLFNTEQENHETDSVYDQKPLAGSLIDIKKPLTIYIKTKKQG